MSPLKRISSNFLCIKGTNEIGNRGLSAVFVAWLATGALVSLGILFVWTANTRPLAISLLVSGGAVFTVGVPLGAISIFRAINIDKADKDALNRPRIFDTENNNL